MTTVGGRVRSGEVAGSGAFDITQDPDKSDSNGKPSTGETSSSGGRDSLRTEIALGRIAEAIRDLRNVRRHQFGLAIEEPAWDMLIELYVRDNIGVSTTAAQLKEASDVPPSTSQRWLQHLEREGFVKTKAHPTDLQTEFVELTDYAREALERYLAAVRAVAAQQSAEDQAR